MRVKLKNFGVNQSRFSSEVDSTYISYKRMPKLYSRSAKRNPYIQSWAYHGILRKMN